MLLMSRVCAEFHDKAGAVLFAIRPADRLTFLEAPESIRQDPLFDLLLMDGSLEIPATKAQRSKLENDPIAQAVASAEDPAPGVDAPVTDPKASGKKAKA